MREYSSDYNVKIGIALSYIYLVISILGALFITPYLLNQIGDANFGLLSFCTSITSWIGIITSALSGSFLYFINQEIKSSGTNNKTPSLFLKLYVWIALAAFAIISICVGFCKIKHIGLSQYSDAENNLIFCLLLISSLQVCVTMVFNTFSHYLVYKNSFIFLRTVTIILAVMVYIGNVVTAFLFRSIIAIAIISAFSALITGLLSAFYAIKRKNLQLQTVSFNENKNVLTKIAKYAGIIMIGAISNNLHNNIDKTILGIMVNSTTVTMYQLSVTFVAYLVSIAYIFTETLEPRFHEYYRNNQIESVNTLYLKTAKIQALILFFIVGGYVTVGYDFVTLWIGEARTEVYFYSVVLMATEIVPLCNTGGGVCARALFKHKFGTIVNISSAVFNVMISIFLVSIFPEKYAIWGCIIGTVIARIVDSHIIMPIYYKKVCELPVKRYYMQLLKYCAIAVIGVFVSKSIMQILFASVSELLIRFILSGIFYVVVYLCLIVIIDRDTLKNIRMLISKR